MKCWVTFHAAGHLFHDCGPEFLFETCVAMKFVDDDDADSSQTLLHDSHFKNFIVLSLVMTPSQCSASAAKVASTSLLTSKLFSSNFVIHCSSVVCYTWWAVSIPSLRLFTFFHTFTYWPWPSKLSAVPTHMMNIYAKFRSDPVTNYRAITSREIRVNRWTPDGRTTSPHDASCHSVLVMQA